MAWVKPVLVRCMTGVRPVCLQMTCVGPVVVLTRRCITGLSLDDLYMTDDRPVHDWCPTGVSVYYLCRTDDRPLHDPCMTGVSLMVCV